jgi:hypothetical protein
MGCRFPEHHGHAGGVVPGAVLAVAAVAVVSAAATVIADALAVVLVVLGVAAAGGGWLAVRQWRERPALLVLTPARVPVRQVAAARPRAIEAARPSLLTVVNSSTMVVLPPREGAGK